MHRLLDLVMAASEWTGKFWQHWFQHLLVVEHFWDPVSCIVVKLLGNQGTLILNFQRPSLIVTDVPGLQSLPQSRQVDFSCLVPAPLKSNLLFSCMLLWKPKHIHNLSLASVLIVCDAPDLGVTAALGLTGEVSKFFGSSTCLSLKLLKPKLLFSCMFSTETRTKNFFRKKDDDDDGWEAGKKLL